MDQIKRKDLTVTFSVVCRLALNHTKQNRDMFNDNIEEFAAVGISKWILQLKSNVFFPPSFVQFYNPSSKQAGKPEVIGDNVAVRTGNNDTGDCGDYPLFPNQSPSYKWKIISLECLLHFYTGVGVYDMT